HRLHFCANPRSVRPEGLTGKVPNLPVPIRDEQSGKSLVYLGYVSGGYLDERVASERTQFEIPDDPTDLFPDEPSWPEILQRALERAKEFLGPYTEPLRTAKLDQIQEYVRTKAPEYRPVVRHRADLLETIPHGLSDEKLDLELYRINQIYDGQLRARY